MVVGDGQDLMFLATDSSNPVPACLNGTKNPVSSGLRNPALMKTEGKTKRKTSIMLEWYTLVFNNSTSDGRPVVCNGLANNNECRVYQVIFSKINVYK